MTPCPLIRCYPVSWPIVYSYCSEEVLEHCKCQRIFVEWLSEWMNECVYDCGVWRLWQKIPEGSVHFAVDWLRWSAILSRFSIVPSSSTLASQDLLPASYQSPFMPDTPVEGVINCCNEHMASEGDGEVLSLEDPARGQCAQYYCEGLGWRGAQESGYGLLGDRK